ncbi:hypothetical protein ACP70R_008371 [Stipagrostis hirtigluma subsp. patula]
MMTAMVIALLVLGIAPLASSQSKDIFCRVNTSSHNETKYQANLELLSTMLPDNVSSTPFLFAKGSVGVTPDNIYGLAFCRGKPTASRCSNCITTAFQGAQEHCPFSREVTFYHEGCHIRFSDYDFLEQVNSWETDDSLTVINTNDIHSWERSGTDSNITSIVKELLQKTAKLAADGLTSSYATGSIEDVSSSFPLYSMAQCTPDLTPTACWACLKNASEMALDNLVAGVNAIEVIHLQCDLRYDQYKFYTGDPMYNIGTSGAAPPPAPVAAPPAPVANQKRKVLVIAVVVPLSLFTCVIIVSIGFIRRSKKGQSRSHEDEELVWELEGRNSEFIVYEFSEVLGATNNFSDENKLGQGGFGPVYKGRFQDGLEIAVKRLASHSRQGFIEFKNEVQLIAKLQHNNLVRLLGCCSHGEEKILIYEYLPNKSLDFFIFDETRRASLNWRKRLAIIEGISQGLLYLHKHSRLRVIHRDLKASNILLDHEMNPKISDFGLAKIFSNNDTEGNTNRIVGTYGYMAPEYASKGIFSVKSDVFSFGVLTLEIISGKKMSSFHRHEDFINLLGHAWQRWKDGLWLEVIDATLDAGCNAIEIIRCINMALLCVQEDAVQRPTMLEVVQMLSSKSMTLPEPTHPAYFHVRVRNEEASVAVEPGSHNDASISSLDGR